MTEIVIFNMVELLWEKIYMSLIVTVWTTEGIVMGSDSRISFSSQIAPNIPVNIQTGHYFDTQEKTFLCPNNCGISTCGAASLQNKNIAGYIYDFVSNALPMRSLSRALQLGKLGEQIVLVSEKAFARILFVDAVPVVKEDYYPKFLARDTKARRSFKEDIEKKKPYKDDIFVMDILREEIKNDDTRIQRIILE